MTPLPNYPNWSRQHHYNEKICKARSTVERFFGVLKGTWRCLSYQRVLMYAPGIAGNIVNACAVLHNMRLHYRLPLDIDNAPADEVNAPAHVEEDLEVDVVPRGPRATAQRIQKQVMREWFPNYRCAWDGE